MIVLNVLPAKGSIKGIAIFPFILVKKGSKTDPILLNHERIHLRQQKEMLIFPFYVVYLMEWIVKSIRYRKDAYREISFEREAYFNEQDLSYPTKRKFWGWLKYLNKHEQIYGSDGRI